MKKRSFTHAFLLGGIMTMAGITQAATPGNEPWLNATLGPDARASLVSKEMTQAEKLSLVRGWLGIPYHPEAPKQFQGTKQFHDIIGSSGYVPGIARLGIPPLQETDASLGVANLGGMMRPGDVATALPSGLTLGASFDPQIAYDSGAVIAREAWHKGLNVLLGPGVNLVRDPRGGRNFEYLSEDPLLTGKLAGQSIRGIQEQHVIATIKHYAVNDQETNRNWANAIIGESAMRESDLLAFEFAIEDGHPGSLMCSYNLVNGKYACGNGHLLNDILKDDWGYPGWVMSDWGAVNDVDFANTGLDQESGAMLDGTPWFGKPLAQAIAAGSVPATRLDNMVHRILRSMFAVGLVDHPPVKSDIDYKADGDVALRESEDGIVLLKNRDGLLPLEQNVRHIAVIGGYADSGVLSGGGSTQVYPVGKPGASVPLGAERSMGPLAVSMIYDPSSPLKAMRLLVPKVEIRFDSGRYPSAAAKLAKWADVVIVFATQWSTEGKDLPDLALPGGQDQLIDAVAAANPKTVVVLETGGAVAMPWLDNVAAVIEAWYPGQRGGEAIAKILYGKVNPSGHLPITFPKNIDQYPRPQIPGSDVVEPNPMLQKSAGEVFNVHYSEGADVGYRWFAKQGIAPLFPFGYGLSYTTFDYSNLKVKGGKTLTVSFDVANTGAVPGKAVPQVYLKSRTGISLQRLIGFAKMDLEPGEKQHVMVKVDRRLLADFDAQADRWRIPAGAYKVGVGRSADDFVLTGSANVISGSLKP